MAWDGNGNLILPFSWANDAANGIPITASRMDTQFNTVATTGFGNTVTRDNQGKPSANFLPDTNNAYTMGSAAYQWSNVYTAGSVYFGGIAFSQTIGTWTPADASGAGLSLTINSAKYTKLGNVVFAYADITYPATADTNGAAISGLPVPAQTPLPVPVTNANVGGENMEFFINGSGSSSGFFANAQNGSPFTNANLSTFRLRLWLPYFVT